MRNVFFQISKEKMEILSDRTRNLITIFRCCGRECDRRCYLSSNAYCLSFFFIILSNRLIPWNFLPLPFGRQMLVFAFGSLSHTECSRLVDVLPFGRSI